MLQAITNFFTRTDPNWLRFRAEAERRAQFTPDILDIQQLYAVNVFVYNECMASGPKHTTLGPNAKYGGLAYTESSDFVLYKKELGNETFPIAFPVTDEQKIGMSTLIGDPGQVMGEVWSIRPDDLISLDYYMLNTVRFNRKPVNITIPYRADTNSEFEPVTKEVFMYVGDLDHWKDQLLDNEMRKSLVPSKRLFCVKDRNFNETLGSYFVFDYNIEAYRK
jgi:hypothetical protein